MSAQQPGAPGRRTIDSALAGSTLTGHDGSVGYQPVALMPDVREVKIGGPSIRDRGRAASPQ